MAPHLKTRTDAGSPVRGRPRQSSSQQPQHHSSPSHHDGSNQLHTSPNRRVLPPRAEKRHPPRPPSHKSHSMRSHSQQSLPSIHPSNNTTSSTSDLRNAYKAQHQSNAARLHQQQHPQQQQQQQQHFQKNDSNGNLRHYDDHCSMSSMSAANSGATPSSVYMPSVPLSRDVSDLSGLSGGTRASSVPGQIFDPKTFQQPWRQAYCLSLQPPPTTMQGRESESDAKNNDNNNRYGENQNRGPSIWVAQNDVVEIFDNLQSALGLDRFQMAGHNRIPIMILLMDPHRHCYELMQIWVDRAMDSIRDLMHALQQNLSQDHSHSTNHLHHHHHQQQHQSQPQKPSSWKQAYDGIFQVRGHRFTQLINIIRLVKYDVQPHEVLVAKPWGMTAKVTIAFAGTIIRHLKSIGVISPGPSGAKPSGAIEDAPLLLSKKAQERAYFPQGILNHHHAVQFVSFAPPFEKTVHIAGLSSSRSQDDALSSLGSLSGDRQDVKNLIATLRLPRTDENPPSPKSVIEIPVIEDAPTPQRNTSGCGIINVDPEEQSWSRGHVDYTQPTAASKPGMRGFFSKLNCCRQNGTNTSNKINNNKNQRMSSPLMHNMDSVSLSSMTPNTTAVAAKLQQIRESSLTSLSEEEELQWLAYSIQPIAEDQSLTGGSVISMSAPLLKAPPHVEACSGGPSHVRESAGGFPQTRPYTERGRDAYEF